MSKTFFINCKLIGCALLRDKSSIKLPIQVPGIRLNKLNKSFIIYGLLAGILAILSYGIVVWSMQYLEIAYVSSIRETSIVIATLMGFFILEEKKAKGRILPAVLVVIGITIVYFQI